jgi:hypothetical protein
MKKIFVLLALAMLFARCSQFSAPQTYSPEAISELTADLKKISENYKIEEVKIFEKDQLSGEFGMVVVTMRDKEDKKMEQTLYYHFNIPHNDPKEVRDHGDYRKNTYVNVDDIIAQKDKIKDYVEEATKQITEMSEDKYNHDSVGDLIFTTDKQGNLLIKFTINCTEKGKSARREGGRMVTDYYGIDFYVDTGGKVIYEE